MAGSGSQRPAISAQQAAVLEAMAAGAVVRMKEGYGDAPRDVRLSVPGEFFGRRLTEAVQMGTVKGLELRGLIHNITPMEKRTYGRWNLGITQRGRRELAEYQKAGTRERGPGVRVPNAERRVAHG